MKKKLLSLFLALIMVCNVVPSSFSAIDPEKNVGKRIPAIPYGENRKPVSVLVIPIVESGEVIGYLPASGTDNLDGTATLNTTGGGGAGVDPVGLKNIAAATINPATEDTLVLVKTNLDDVKTKLDTLNANDFATEATLALMKTAVDAINSDIDVALSTRASEATLALIKTGVDDLNTKLATLNATDFATEATLATRATEATLATRATEATLATRATEATLLAIKAQTDKLTFIVDELKVTDAGVGGGGGMGRAESLAANGQMFVFASDETNFTPSGSELPFVLIRNPAASGKQLRIRGLTQSIVSTNKPTTFRAYFNPTVTVNGAAQAVVNKLSDSVIATVALITTIPTISDNGDRVAASVPVAGVFAVDAAFSVIIAEGDSLLITVEATVNNTEVDITIDWSEV